MTLYYLVIKIKSTYAVATLRTHFPNGINEPLSLILDLQFLLLQPACRSHSLNKNFCPLQGPQWQEILPKRSRKIYYEHRIRVIGTKGEKEKWWTEIENGVKEFHVQLTQHITYNSRSGWYVPSMSKQTSATLSGLLPFCAELSFLLNKIIIVDMLLSKKTLQIWKHHISKWFSRTSHQKFLCSSRGELNSF